jgi:hypothetical protein
VDRRTRRHHALFTLDRFKWTRFLVCTHNVIPRWGIDLAEQNTFAPATCLWCIAGEKKPLEKP